MKYLTKILSVCRTYLKIFPTLFIHVVALMLVTGCNNDSDSSVYLQNTQIPNVLNYASNPQHPKDKGSLVFSDQGAWFGYGLSLDKKRTGFTGPFLMTQENGLWCSSMLGELKLFFDDGAQVYWDSVLQYSYNSHLDQSYYNSKVDLNQRLVYSSPHSVLHISTIKNISSLPLTLNAVIEGTIFLDDIILKRSGDALEVISGKSSAKGYLKFYNDKVKVNAPNNSTYSAQFLPLIIEPGNTETIIFSQSFIFPEYEFDHELANLMVAANNYDSLIHRRVSEKVKEYGVFESELMDKFNDVEYKKLICKCLLTLQNNWRIPSGELKHSGLFPSYHYKWFHGFWAWDSWKHAVALAEFNPELAKEQIRVMYDFMDKDGFIADCIYRDTTIENHNYRNTKPPLSGWAVWKVYGNDNDTSFLQEMYPKLLKQHYWWYKYRDYDNDSICEYGSTDGSLIAAKWESGMDNAVRFDNSQLLKSKDNAYSLNQESVDLNSYLYAEKVYLRKMAKVLGENDVANILADEAEILKYKIRNQFYSDEKSWYYDTSIDGDTIINVMGCEGWIPLWAGVATKAQASNVVENMMNDSKFNTKVPLQTLSADHPKFKPDGGYWRGPTWIDQAYFGVIGMRNYGYDDEADTIVFKLINNAEGLLESGPSIRENYNPLTGEGLESHNFSWSAAHYLLILTDNEK